MPPERTVAVEARQLVKRYRGVAVVDEVGFEVAHGEVFGLLGPNGAGKTTTIEIVQGLRRADAGSVRVLGLDPIADIARLRDRIGSQLQNSALPDRLRVWEALDLFSAMSGRSGDWRPLLEQWGLAEQRDTPFAQLSGGQRQRLFVALALRSAPEVVFLDEMTTGLDPAARRIAWDMVRAVADRGTTVVLVTHFMDEAEHLCDRVAVLRAGRLAAVGTPDELVQRYAPRMRVQFRSHDADLGWLESIPGLEQVHRSDGAVELVGVDPMLVRTCAELVRRGCDTRGLRVRQADLEDAFLAITGTRAGES
ncbi:ATP-binding cassette domain-containing protein [Nocardia sp. ET3-3]|uniref:ATP-binding cassette domain-containing protein n=1 Tax=Nocardia terrae TaxID=2675851 RepID=A0A7K1V7D3_9NOCA|nr:ABC transporter ATP-binding protein [Nocardia terrae]MVU82369.1 ATP-binding cassette domain-containing protein [Nocardia terrae]